MTNNYWPWWMGGGLLAIVAIAFPLLNGAPLGVSGALARLLHWRSEKPTGNPPTNQRLENLLFLVGILGGGAIAGWVGGQPLGSGAKLSTEFYRLFGSGVRAVLALFAGGILVGFGTRWSGGCTSGHGLSGCGRLQPPSLIATAVFFGVAIAVSFVLERVLS